MLFDVLRSFFFRLMFKCFPLSFSYLCWHATCIKHCLPNDISECKQTHQQKKTYSDRCATPFISLWKRKMGKTKRNNNSQTEFRILNEFILVFKSLYLFLSTCWHETHFSWEKKKYFWFHIIIFLSNEKLSSSESSGSFLKNIFKKKPSSISCMQAKSSFQIFSKYLLWKDE